MIEAQIRATAQTKLIKIKAMTKTVTSMAVQASLLFGTQFSVTNNIGVVQFQERNEMHKTPESQSGVQCVRDVGGDVQRPAGDAH